MFQKNITLNDRSSGDTRLILFTSTLFFFNILKHYFAVQYQIPIFSFEDMALYSECRDAGINIVYEWIVCYGGLQDVKSISSGLMASSFSCLGIWIVGREVNRIYGIRVTGYFFLIVAFHPYFSVYSIKFSSTTFEIVGFAILFSIVARDFRLQRNQILSCCVLVFCRNSFLLPTLLVFARALRIKAFYIIILVLLFFLLFVFFDISSGIYLNQFLDSASEKPLWWKNHFFSIHYGLDNSVDVVLNLVVRIISLLGFRESFFIEFDRWTAHEDFVWYLLFSFFLAVVHLMGLIVLVKEFPGAAWLFSSALISIFLVTSMRYLVPAMPLICLGLAVLFDRFYEKWFKYD